jgi:hypothetical protein
MSTFKIYFFGLVCHVGEIETEKEFAAVVRAPGHNRYIVWNNGGIALTDAVKKIAFKFDGAFDRKNAEPDNLFRTFVPRLQKLMGGSLETDAHLSRHAIKVEYPASIRNGARDGSKLSVTQLYDHKAVHIAGGKIVRPVQCVARLTELTIERTEAAMEVYAIGASGDETRLTSIPDGECLLISSQTLERDRFPFALFDAIDSTRDGNEHVHTDREGAQHGHATSTGTAAHAHPTGTHVQHYAVIVRENTPNVYVGESAERGCDDPGAIACSWVTGIIDIDLMTGTHAECGNTNWP